MQKTIEIHADFLDIVLAKIAKANKKAAVLNITPLVIDSTTPYINKVDVKNGPPMYFKMLRIELSYEPLKFGEYTFVATLDHSVGKHPIINTAPEQIVPDEYFTVASRCDHCSTARFRKETFLFKDVNGYKLVGRSCLKDFFGVDPTKNIDWFFSCDNLSDGYGGRGEQVTPVDYAIALGLAFTKRFGYISSKQAAAYAEKSGGQASLLTTGNEVRSFVFAPPLFPTKEETQFRCELHAEADAFMEQAQELIKWGLQHFAEDNSSYAHNMRNLLDTEAVTGRYIGYVVSVIAAHVRSLEQEADRKFVKKSNEYVGAVGERAVFEVTVLKHMTFDTDFGTTHLFTMADALGNNLVWFASGNNLDVGDTVKLKGTVKAHNERNGFKQTVLTRCKVQ